MQTIAAHLNNILLTIIPSNVELVSVPKSPHVWKIYLDFPCYSFSKILVCFVAVSS